MIKKLALLGAALVLSFPAVAATPQPNWLSGLYTLAAGPDNLQANLPAGAYCYSVAWAIDRPGGAGFMAADCGLTPAAWVTNAGPQGVAGSTGATGATGAPGVDGNTVLSGTGAPSGGLGKNGDYYLDVTVTRLYGPKTSGVWGTGVVLIGPQGSPGANGTNGTNGSPGVNSFGAYNARTLSLATAYQATDNTKPAIVTINLSSTANISLSGGTTNSATVVVGSTTGVASGTGTVACPYTNSNTGALTIGLALATTATTTCTIALRAGDYFAVRQTSGTVTITSAFDQSVG